MSGLIRWGVTLMIYFIGLIAVYVGADVFGFGDSVPYIIGFLMGSVAYAVDHRFRMNKTHEAFLQSYADKCGNS